MTGEAAALVNHGQLGVASVFERGQGNVSAREFVVAAAAESGDVTRRAAFPIDGGIFPVRVVSPAPGV